MSGFNGFDVMKKTVKCDMLKKILNYPSARVKFENLLSFEGKKNKQSNEQSNIIWKKIPK